MVNVSQNKTVLESIPDNAEPLISATEEGSDCIQVNLDAEAISILQAIFNLAPAEDCDAGVREQVHDKSELIEEQLITARVKFMITMQDEINLQALGYSESHIRKLKPHEAAEIIQAGTKAEPSSGIDH